MSEPMTQAEAVEMLRQKAAENNAAYTTLKEAEIAVSQAEENSL